MRKIIFLMVVVLSLFTLTACSGYYGKEDIAKTIQQTEDGGYILAGNTVHKQDGRPSEALLIKVDSQGEEEWSQNFPDSGAATVNSVLQTPDGGYVLAGQTRVAGARSDALLIKVDAYGNEEWVQIFGGDESDFLYSIQPTQDGGYILAGSTASDGANNAWLIKTDSLGNEEWSQTFGGSESDYGRAALQTEDGGYILAGTTNSFGSDNPDGWLIKTDYLGNEEWSQVFGGSESDSVWAALQTEDGGYILAGSTNSFDTKSFAGWLIKTDSQGNEEWSQIFGGSDGDFFYSVQQTRDGGYIASGSTGTYSDSGLLVGWLVKTDAVGNEEWSRAFGEPRFETVQQTEDGGYILVGPGRVSTVHSTHLVKTDTLGNEEWSRSFVASSGNAGLLRVLSMFMVVIVFNISYFLIFIKDMGRRGERKLVWFITFLFLGPVAVTWYKSYRKQKDAEVVKGNKLYRLAKHFFLPWSIYALLMPLIFWVIISIFDGLDAGQFAEGMFWFILIYILFVIPAYLGSLLIPGIVLLVNINSKNSASG